ncbi:uncharacterized protein LOC118566353 isoform X2 [Fundulus heteroclitus]|uniref:uncharacterized protein LOC118566353 isoform X2 n=1 Tax=Fundulus heteroclitus TaxID=8078 RepID=UPI00165BE171|nr:uncharacterized protein LOC118566353 isoform X2 [Fundulus heteroclitus]
MMKVNYFPSKEKELELKLVDEFISEELSAMNKEKELELKMVDEFISEELSAMNKERESGLKIVEKFIPEELSEMNKESELKMVDRFISEEVLGVSKDKKSELKMMNTSITEEPSEVKEIKKIISQQCLQTQDISEDITEPCKNQGLNDRAVPVITAKPQNKGVGVKIKTFLQKYSQ